MSGSALRLRLLLVCCAGWLIVPVIGHTGVDRPGAQLAEAPGSPLEAEIARLITQLGHPQYHAREKAQEDLQRLGTTAFDALLAAQDHTDIEIAMRARYLVRSMSVAWTKETDSAEVQQLFRDYGSRDREERATRARHFASLEDPAGMTALCRIVRFDVDRVLSKEAAVLILNSAWPTTEEARLQRAERIRAEVALSRRTGADWLRLYVKTLESPAETAAEWDKTIRDELEQLARQPQDSDRKLLIDLLRWQAQFFVRLGRGEEALACVRRSCDLLGDDRRMLYEMLDWSVEHGLHQIADELAARFTAAFRDDSRLIYRLAESQLKRGLGDLAAATAQRARELAPDSLQQHFAIAGLLQYRTLTDWAEQEFRQIINRTKPTEEFGAKSRWALAEMLFDAQHELEAAELAKSLVEAAANGQQIFEFIDPDSSQLQGYMNYYFGMHFARLGDRDKQIEYFRRAITDWPDNPDFIIAMYRLPMPDDAWRKEVKDRIEAFTGAMHKEIRAIESALQQPMNDDERSRNGEFLAGRLNELAWLISNTEGDMQLAVKASQQSLELRPENAAYLDTLGRCYFASGDFENAVKVQSRAIKLMPYMFVMRRQLSQFEKALAESKAKQPPSTANDKEDRGK